MLKKILAVVFITMGVLSLQAQERDETPVVSPDEVHPEIEKKSGTTDKKFDIGLSAGTSFVYSKNSGGGMSTFVAPELTYKLTPRVHLNVGVMLLNSNLVYNRYRMMDDEPSVVVRTKPAFSTLAYVSGDYLINDRLTVSGMLMRDLSGTSRFGSYTPSIQAMSLHLDYKITDHMSIGAGVHMRQGNYLGYPGYANGIYPGSLPDPVRGY